MVSCPSLQQSHQKRVIQEFFQQHPEVIGLISGKNGSPHVLIGRARAAELGLDEGYGEMSYHIRRSDGQDEEAED